MARRSNPPVGFILVLLVVLGFGGMVALGSGGDGASNSVQPLLTTQPESFGGGVSDEASTPPQIDGDKASGADGGAAGTLDLDQETDPASSFVPAPREPEKAPKAQVEANTSGATARCRDGDLSYSKHRPGTCSGHEGVAFWY